MSSPVRLSLAAAAFLVVAGAAASATAQTEAKTDPLAASKRTTETIGDWVLNCSQGQDGKSRCNLSQRLGRASTKEVILAWLIGKDGDGNPAMSFQTPTGMLLQPGVSLQIDDRGTTAIPYRVCTQRFCEAVLPLNTDMVQAMKAGRKAVLTLMPLSGKATAINLSLKGFTAAYTAYEAQQ